MQTFFELCIDVWKRCINSVSFVLFPRVCVQCGKEKTWLCDPCKKACVLRPMLMSAQKPPQTNGLIAVGSYSTQPLAKLIIMLKYSGAHDVQETLHGLIEHFFATRGSVPFFVHAIVPVPLHPRRMRARGFNQSDLIAQSVGRVLGAPVQQALVRNRFTTPQVSLTRTQRQQNVAGAFGVSKNAQMNGKTIIVVDDVTTTGSTLGECAYALKAAGAAAVYGFVVAQEE